MTNEIVISQPPDITFDKIVNFDDWKYWSPWSIDAKQINLQTGQSKMHEGMSIKWGDVPEDQGELTVVSLRKDTEIKAHLTLSSPMITKTDMNWYFESVPQGTKLTMINEGASFNGPLDRFFGGFLSQKKLEKEFSTSLKNFKQFCES